MNIMLKRKRVILFGFLYGILLIPIINGTLRYLEEPLPVCWWSLGGSQNQIILDKAGGIEDQVNGQILKNGVGYRTGEIRSLSGKSLLVWIEKTSTKPVTISINSTVN